MRYRIDVLDELLWNLRVNHTCRVDVVARPMGPTPSVGGIGRETPVWARVVTASLPGIAAILRSQREAMKCFAQNSRSVRRRSLPGEALTTPDTPAVAQQ